MMKQIRFDLDRLPQKVRKAYIENRGQACAFCGHDSLARGNFEFLDTAGGGSLEAWAEVWCPRCRETVIEVYWLADVTGKVPPKDKEAYIDAGGVRCPHCGSAEIWKGNVVLDIRKGGGWRIECEVWCPTVECWAHYNEVYQLAEVHDPMVPKQDDAPDNLEILEGGRTATLKEVS